jgi:hypothetical protein
MARFTRYWVNWLDFQREWEHGPGQQRTLRPLIIENGLDPDARILAGADGEICIAMTKQTIELDMRRGMAAQKATELRRLMSEVVANEALLRSRQKELEEQMLATPALGWADAADKARYLLSLFASSPAAEDPRRQMLIARVLEDFVRLSTSDQAEQP